MSKILEKIAYDDITHNCDTLKSQVDLYLSNIDLNLNHIADSPLVLSKDYDHIDPVFKNLIDDLILINQIIIADTQGNVRYSSSNVDMFFNISDRAYFQKALQGQSNFSDSILSKISNGPFVVYAKPIMRYGKIDGVIAASIDLEFLSTKALETHLQKPSDVIYGYIVDSKGQIIGHPDLSLVQQRYDATYLPPVTAVIDNQTGIGTYTYENIDKFAAYTPSDIANWGILFQIPVSEALKEIDTLNSIINYSGIYVLLISIFCIFIASLFIKRPIDKIMHLLGSISHDEFTVTDYNIQENEFGIIENEIISLTKQIKHSYDMLEHKVEERTNELKYAMNELNQTKNELEKTNKKLESISLTDSLTGIPNRRNLDQYIDNTWEYFKRNNLSVAILMVDIDNFKQFNDTNGHLKGDKCLKVVANTLKKMLHRESDFLARYGGDELMIILNNITKDSIYTITDKLHKGIEAINYPHGSSNVSPYVSVSIGVLLISDWKNLAGNWKNISPKKAILMADNMLYKAKRQGKNQFEIDFL